MSHQPQDPDWRDAFQDALDHLPPLEPDPPSCETGSDPSVSPSFGVQNSSDSVSSDITSSDMVSSDQLDLNGAQQNPNSSLLSSDEHSLDRTDAASDLSGSYPEADSEPSASDDFSQNANESTYVSEAGAANGSGESVGTASSSNAPGFGEPLPNFYGREYETPDPVIPDGWEDGFLPEEKKTPGKAAGFFMRNWAELTFILAVFALMTAWSFTAPHYMPGGPDEPMRNLIVKWLYEHPGQLPFGDEKAIRSDIWGLSYGYYPILSYMVSAAFMMAAGLFTKSAAVLLHIARMADVMFLTIASGFVIKAGKKLFGRSQGLFFASLVIFLPSFHYMGTYINNESLGLMACAIIFCSWAGAYKEGWEWKNVIMLGIGIGLCAMSYYSAYGWILWSFFFFIFSILADTSKPMGKRIGFMITRGLVVTILTLGIAGWWFVRSFLLHDGDLLGIRSANAVAEKYAQQGFKPSDHWTPNRDHWSLINFFLYQNPGWPHNWLILSWVSFVGTFGHFDIYMKEGISKAYQAFMFIGLVSTLLMINMYRLHSHTKTVSLEKHAAGKTRTITIQIDKNFSQEGLFHLFMILAMVTPMALYFYYAYFSDLQAQGRYFICSVFPIMYFVACGFGILVRKIFSRSERVQNWIFGILAAVWLGGAIFNYFTVILPAYL